jgi:hypothetical protein
VNMEKQSFWDLCLLYRTKTFIFFNIHWSHEELAFFSLFKL